MGLPPPKSSKWILALVLAVALGLRLWNAANASFHLDDFHSLFHARAASLVELFENLRRDNHPPLMFLGLKAARAVLGEGELALRVPSLTFGLATVFLTWRLSARLASPLLRGAAALLVACSSLHVELSVDLRMYALLALAVTGLVHALVELVEEGRGRWWVCAWTVVGLHAHYHFVHALVVLGLALVVLLLFEPRSRKRVPALALAWGTALALSLPWVVFGLRAQLQHDLPPGGSTVSLQRLAEAQIHLLYFDISLGGDVLRLLFLAAAAGALLLSVLGLFLSWTHRDGGRARGMGYPLLLGSAAFLLPAWSAISAALLPRTGFEWRYLAGAIAPFAVLVAAGAGEGLPLAAARRAALGLALGAAVVLSCLNARDPGGENYEGGIRYLLESARAEDAVIAADWQPRLFPHSGAWNYYAPRLGEADELPQLIDHDEHFRLLPGTDLSAYERFYVLGRSLPNEAPLFISLRKEFPIERSRAFGRSVWVVVFERFEGR